MEINKLLEKNNNLNIKENKENKENKKDDLYKKVFFDVVEKLNQDILKIIKKDKIVGRFYKKLDYKDKSAFILLLSDFKDISEAIKRLRILILIKSNKVYESLKQKYDEVTNWLSKDMEIKNKKEEIKNKNVRIENKKVFLKEWKEKLKEIINWMKIELKQKASEFEKPIKTQAQQISEKYGISQDEAFIYVFNKFYQENQQFANKIWDIPSQYKW